MFIYNLWCDTIRKKLFFVCLEVCEVTELEFYEFYEFNNFFYHSHPLPLIDFLLLFLEYLLVGGMFSIIKLIFYKNLYVDVKRIDNSTKSL